MSALALLHRFVHISITSGWAHLLRERAYESAGQGQGCIMGQDPQSQKRFVFTLKMADFVGFQQCLNFDQSPLPSLNDNFKAVLDVLLLLSEKHLHFCIQTVIIIIISKLLVQHSFATSRFSLSSTWFRPRHFDVFDFQKSFGGILENRSSKMLHARQFSTVLTSNGASLQLHAERIFKKCSETLSSNEFQNASLATATCRDSFQHNHPQLSWRFAKASSWQACKQQQQNPATLQNIASRAKSFFIATSETGFLAAIFLLLRLRLLTFDEHTCLHSFNFKELSASERLSLQSSAPPPRGCCFSRTHGQILVALEHRLHVQTWEPLPAWCSKRVGAQCQLWGIPCVPSLPSSASLPAVTACEDSVFLLQHPNMVQETKYIRLWSSPCSWNEAAPPHRDRAVLWCPYSARAHALLCAPRRWLRERLHPRTSLLCTLASRQACGETRLVCFEGSTAPEGINPSSFILREIMRNWTFNQHSQFNPAPSAPQAHPAWSRAVPGIGSVLDQLQTPSSLSHGIIPRLQHLGLQILTLRKFRRHRLEQLLGIPQGIFALRSLHGLLNAQV